MLGLGYMISVRNRTSIEALHRAGNLGIMFYGLCYLGNRTPIQTLQRTGNNLGIMFYGLCWD